MPLNQWKRLQRLEGRDVSDGYARAFTHGKSKVSREEMVGLKGQDGSLQSLSVYRYLYDVSRLPNSEASRWENMRCLPVTLWRPVHSLSPSRLAWTF